MEGNTICSIFGKDFREMSRNQLLDYFLGLDKEVSLISNLLEQGKSDYRLAKELDVDKLIMERFTFRTELRHEFYYVLYERIRSECRFSDKSIPDYQAVSDYLLGDYTGCNSVVIRNRIRIQYNSVISSVRARRDGSRSHTKKHR